MTRPALAATAIRIAVAVAAAGLILGAARILQLDVNTYSIVLGLVGGYAIADLDWAISARLYARRAAKEESTQ